MTASTWLIWNQIQLGFNNLLTTIIFLGENKMDIRKRKGSQTERRQISAPGSTSCLAQTVVGKERQRLFCKDKSTSKVVLSCGKSTCRTPVLITWQFRRQVIRTWLGMTNMSPDYGLLCFPPHRHTALSVFLTSSFSLPIDLIRVWPGPVGLFDMQLCWTGPRGLPEKELCTGSADRLTQPLPASDPLLTGSPVYQGWKKCKQRGSVHPGTEHRTSFILSPILLPDSPILTSGWLYFEIKKYCPWWWSEVIWKHIPSFNRCPKDKLCVSAPCKWGRAIPAPVCLEQPHLWNLSHHIRKGRDEQRSWARFIISVT